MTGTEAQPQAQLSVKEPAGIKFLGGPLHGRSIVDRGYDQVREGDDIYKRVKISLTRGETMVEKDFFIYWGLCYG